MGVGRRRVSEWAADSERVCQWDVLLLLGRAHVRGQDEFRGLWRGEKPDKLWSRWSRRHEMGYCEPCLGAKSRWQYVPFTWCGENGTSPSWPSSPKAIIPVRSQKSNWQEPHAGIGFKVIKHKKCLRNSLSMRT